MAHAPARAAAHGRPSMPCATNTPHLSLQRLPSPFCCATKPLLLYSPLSPSPRRKPEHPQRPGSLAARHDRRLHLACRGAPPPAILHPREPSESVPHLPLVLSGRSSPLLPRRSATGTACPLRRSCCSVAPPPPAVPAPTEAIHGFLSTPWSFSPTSPTPPVSPHAGFRPAMFAPTSVFWPGTYL